MKSEENKNFESEADRISLEAIAWIAKRDEGFTAADQDAFFEWLAADPKHKEMYHRRLDLWGEMDLLTDWRPEHSLKPNPDLLAVKKKGFKSTSRVVAAASIAAIVVLSVFFMIDWSGPFKSDTRMLAFGGAQDYESYVLDDGSLVELNQGAQVSVQYSKHQRLIFLHTGEAHFTVEKDVGRPFLVRAGGAVVEATGTAFNVSLQDHGIEVLVTEGRVKLHTSPDADSEAIEESSENESQELVAGQKSLVSNPAAPEDFQVETVTFEEIDRRLSWKGEVLDFADVPLSRVTHEFNRRNGTQILIADQDLLNLKITAKLRSSNLEQFVELLDITMNIKARRDGPSRIILTKEKGFPPQ
jgi:transmembrane sensor